MTTLIPAYGRDYKSKKAVQADWDAGKDFIIADVHNPFDGKYTSKADWTGKTVMIRYKKLTEIQAFKG